MSPRSDVRVGELRPSQLLFSFGVGATVDLPNISAMVMGLDDWDTTHSSQISEERLLAAVREQLGPQVERLLSPPQSPESGGFSSPFEASSTVGVPVAPFPRWMLCPYCRLLAPLKSDLFKLRPDVFRPDRTAYIHENCRKRGTRRWRSPPGSCWPASAATSTTSLGSPSSTGGRRNAVIY